MSRGGWGVGRREKGWMKEREGRGVVGSKGEGGRDREVRCVSRESQSWIYRYWRVVVCYFERTFKACEV